MDVRRKTPMELIVWHGDYGLVSMNCECTRLVMYVKFAQVPIEIRYQRNPYWYGKGAFPILRDNQFTFNKFHTAIEHLRFKRYSLDFGLSTKCCSEMMAFMCLIQKMLEPVIEYVFWIDKRNFEQFTRPWYARVMPLFLNITYCSQRKKKAQSILDVHYPNIDDNAALLIYIRRSASECFSILSTRLGNNDFFYGNSPSTLDCTVYSYLAPLLRVPFPSNEIPHMLDPWPRLQEYVNRIDAKYFPDMKAAPRFLKDEAKTDDAGASMKLKMATFTFVTCVLLGYAINNKIISLPKHSIAIYNN